MADKLMVIAHPDDESIFGGSLLLKYRGWKVICVTNGTNRIRKREFTQAMNFVGAQFEIWSYPDRWNGDFDRIALKKDLTHIVRSKKWKVIVTHNLSGEYGHTQHQAISRLMHQMAPRNLYIFKLSTTRLPSAVLSKKWNLLKHYKSQPINNWKKYILYEGVTKVT